jgi:hypothetical protein
MDDVICVAAGDGHSLAVKTDGSLWAWGNNTLGQLGDGTNLSRNKPVKIMDGVFSVAAKEFHSLALKKDGSLWAWGNNEYGQLGDGTTINRYTPVKIMDGVKLPAATTAQPVTPPPTTLHFSDVPAHHWAYSSIMLLAQKGVIEGYADGTFRPQGLVTRSEFAKMMTLALGIPLLTNPAPSFADVSGNSWDFVYVETAKKYLTGYQQGNTYYFKGGEQAVREDMAVALVKALKLENEQADVDELKTVFKDSHTISPNLQKHVLIAYKNGLINGYPDGSFGAQKPITRAETASLLIKVLDSEAMKKVTFD